jgi:hypothetical protein
MASRRVSHRAVAGDRSAIGCERESVIVDDCLLGDLEISE